MENPLGLNPVTAATEAAEKGKEIINDQAERIQKNPLPQIITYSIIANFLLAALIWWLFRGQHVEDKAEIARLNGVIAAMQKEHQRELDIKDGDHQKQINRYDSVLNQRNELIYELYKTSLHGN